MLSLSRRVLLEETLCYLHLFILGRARFFGPLGPCIINILFLMDASVSKGRPFS